eukprot:3785091-Rhodomonas_salina.3
MAYRIDGVVYTRVVHLSFPAPAPTPPSHAGTPHAAMRRQQPPRHGWAGLRGVLGSVFSTPFFCERKTDLLFVPSTSTCPHSPAPLSAVTLQRAPTTVSLNNALPLAHSELVPRASAQGPGAASQRKRRREGLTSPGITTLPVLKMVSRSSGAHG